MRLPELLKPAVAPVERATYEARAAAAMFRRGAVGIDRPSRTFSGLKALNDFGPLGAAVRLAALRHPDQDAVIDERGSLTWTQLDEDTNRLAAGLLAEGLSPGDTIGILCRNHRVALQAAFAASRAGLNAVWLNTSFSERQAREVAEREGVQLLIHDVEFAAVVEEVQLEHGSYTVDIEQPEDDITKLCAGRSGALPKPPAKPGRIVLLTSGTTGTPKGAARSEPRSLVLPGSLLERMPMGARETTIMGPPLYHGTGLILAMVSIALGSTLVLRRKFDPEQFLADVEEHKATTVCVVPIMLQRVLALGDEKIAAHDTKSLKVVFCAGSRLPSEVARSWTSHFGETIYNLYGSTEVAVATLATPADVRDAPDSVGKPALGARLRILGDGDQELPTGETGRIFVGTTSPFEGYTGGGSKDVVGGMMATGDVGHMGPDGRLYIDGRDDEMIVSGGENVFPGEVEELLVTHPGVLEAAAMGVDDEDFGQRLKAFVVLKDGKEVSEQELKDLVKDNLARYKVPREIVFLPELPRNPTGKVLKRELVEEG